MKKLIILMVISGVLTACSSDHGSGSSGYKDLFSSWTDPDGIVFDLTGKGFGPHALSYAVSPNTGCDCMIEILGTQDSGSARLYSCDHYGPVDYCTSGQRVFNYEKNGATMTVCEGSACGVWR